jgi:hypothetical protein
LGTLPKRSILSAWFGRLPEEKAAVYDACAVELESGFNLLSIALNEGLRLKELGHIRSARETAALCRELAQRHARLLESVLRVLDRESRHLALLPDALPFEVEAFRTPAARSSCFWNGLLHRVLFSFRTRWFHKLHSLQEIVGQVSQAFLQSAEELSSGFSLAPSVEWEALETLHDDWNTCLRETVVVLKCLLDSAASHELAGLRRELEALRSTAKRRASELLAEETIEGQGSHTQGRPCI